MLLVGCSQAEHALSVTTVLIVQWFADCSSLKGPIVYSQWVKKSSAFDSFPSNISRLHLWADVTSSQAQSGVLRIAGKSDLGNITIEHFASSVSNSSIPTCWSPDANYASSRRSGVFSMSGLWHDSSMFVPILLISESTVSPPQSEHS